MDRHHEVDNRRVDEMRKARLGLSSVPAASSHKKASLPPVPVDHGETRNWKLIVDPFLKKGLPKLYRFHGVTAGQANSAHNVVNLIDPRTNTPRFYARSGATDLRIPPFKIDENYVGTPPAREVSFFQLNDNINEQFLRNLCSKFGETTETTICYHPVTKKHLGLAKVIFTKVRAASACVAKYNNQSVMGKVITCCVDVYGRLLKKRVEDLTDVHSSGFGSESASEPIKPAFTVNSHPQEDYGAFDEEDVVAPEAVTAAWPDRPSSWVSQPPPPPTFAPPAHLHSGSSPHQQYPSGVIAAPPTAPPAASTASIVEALTTLLTAARNKTVVTQPIVPPLAAAYPSVSPADTAHTTDSARQNAMITEQLAQLQALAVKEKQQQLETNSMDDMSAGQTWSKRDQSTERDSREGSAAARRNRHLYDHRTAESSDRHRDRHRQRNNSSDSGSNNDDKRRKRRHKDRRRLANGSPNEDTFGHRQQRAPDSMPTPSGLRVSSQHPHHVTDNAREEGELEEISSSSGNDDDDAGGAGGEASRPPSSARGRCQPGENEGQQPPPRRRSEQRSNCDPDDWRSRRRGDRDGRRTTSRGSRERRNSSERRESTERHRHHLGRTDDARRRNARHSRSKTPVQQQRRGRDRRRGRGSPSPVEYHRSDSLERIAHLNAPDGSERPGGGLLPHVGPPIIDDPAEEMEIVSESETSGGQPADDDTGSIANQTTPVMDEISYSPQKAEIAPAAASFSDSLESRIQSILSGAKREVMKVLAAETTQQPKIATIAPPPPATSCLLEDREEDEMSLSSGGGGDTMNTMDDFADPSLLAHIQPPSAPPPQTVHAPSLTHGYGSWPSLSSTVQHQQQPNTILPPPLPPPAMLQPPLPPSIPAAFRHSSGYPVSPAPPHHLDTQHYSAAYPQSMYPYWYHHSAAAAPPLPAQYPTAYATPHGHCTGNVSSSPFAMPPATTHKRLEPSPEDEADLLQRRIRKQLTNDLQSVLQKDICRKMTETVLFPRLEKWWNDTQSVKEKRALQLGEDILLGVAGCGSGRRSASSVVEEANAEETTSMLAGVGLKASMPKLPSFRRKNVRPISPARSMSSNEEEAEERISSRRSRISTTSSDVKREDSRSPIEADADSSQPPSGRSPPSVVKASIEDSPSSTSTDDDEQKPVCQPEKTEVSPETPPKRVIVESDSDEGGDDESEAKLSVAGSLKSGEHDDSSSASSSDESSDDETSSVSTSSDDEEEAADDAVEKPNTDAFANTAAESAQHVPPLSKAEVQSHTANETLVCDTNEEQKRHTDDTLKPTAVVDDECPVDDAMRLGVNEVYSPLYLDHCYPLDPHKMPSSSKMEKKRLSGTGGGMAPLVGTAEEAALTQRFFRRTVAEDDVIRRRVLDRGGVDLEDMSFLKRGYDCLVHDAAVAWPKAVTWVDWRLVQPSAIDDNSAGGGDSCSPPTTKRRRRRRGGKTSVSPDPAASSSAHKSGCARTEGYYKMDKAPRKSFMRRTERVFERTAMQSAQEVNAARQQAQMGREARLAQRRLLTSLDVESDLLKVNLLKFRKKMIKFGRSHIHGWGLFALEGIQPDEMIVEYMGQKVRINVAERRELHYETKGIGSSYLFRIDSDQVIDATKTGNLARFINHSCSPNCYAKIITVEGGKRIVIYSKEYIGVGAEITYDYKFPVEDEKIRCLCQAPNCKGTLN